MNAIKPHHDPRMPRDERSESRGSRRHATPSRGFALLLVMFAIAIATIVGLTFMMGQQTSTAIAQNVNNHAQARMIAESAMAAVLAHLEASNGWRQTQTSGTWLTDQAFNGGTYTLIVEDGEDTNGDGAVDGDGDLADDNSEKVTVRVIARAGGATHEARTVMTPGETLLGPITVLMVVDVVDSLTSAEQGRKDLIKGWGWTVNLIAAGASVGEYTAAMDGVHVIYVPDDGGCNLAGTRLKDATLGIVYEDGEMNEELALSNGQSSYTGSTIRIVDNSHYITSPFAIGDLLIGQTSSRVECPSDSVVGGARPLAWWPGTTRRVVAALDAGATLNDGTAAAGRRAVSPFAGFQADSLTDDGKTLLKRLLEWGAQSAMSSDAVAPLTNWVNGNQITVPSGEDRLLVVTVGCETHASLTSVTYGYQPMTLAISAYESTGVGARTYLYYLRDVELQNATDNRIRTAWTSGSKSDEAYASRAYKFVSQTNPLRVTNSNTNAGPQTVSTEPMEVSDGDMVVASAQVGNPIAYSWASPMVEGIDDVNSTSTHGTADYAVTGNPGTVVAAATCSTPNRQAIVGAVLQPRSQSSGAGVIPQLLVLYEFTEQQPDTELVGHWTFDDPGKGGAIAITDQVKLYDNSLIDGYHSQAGTYAGDNRFKDVILVTNTTTSNNIWLEDWAKIQGSTYNRPGANPTNVVKIRDSAVITGNRYEQSVWFEMPPLSAPTGMPGSSGNVTISSNQTISSDRTYGNLTITNGTVTISGSRRIQITGSFNISGGSINVPAGSSLTMYIAGNATISGQAVIGDILGAGRVEIIGYGSTSDMMVRNNARVCGTVRVGRDLTVQNNAAIYGAVFVGDDLNLYGSGAIHVDLDLPGFGIVPVANDTGANHALAHGGVTFAQSGATAYTGSSLSFDGSDNFVQVIHHDDYLLHHGAIAFWFRSSSLSGQRALISKDSSGYDTGGQLHIYTDGSTLKARIQTNGANPYGTGNDFEVTSSGLSVNSWYHVVVTFGAGGLRLYRNGALVDTEVYPGALSTSSGGIGNYEPLIIGAGTSGSGDLTHLPLDQFFQGRIDDVRIYRGVLDATQVSRLYQGQAIGGRTEPSYLVRDTSGNGTPIDMFIDNTAAVGWVAEGGLTLNQGTTIRAPMSPSKIHNGATATGELSLELVFVPASTDASVRRLFWFGPNSGSNCNIDFYQNGTSAAGRIRSSDTTSNPTALASPSGIVAGQQQHFVLTYNGQFVTIYSGNQLVAQVAQTGHLLTWDTTFGLTFASLPQGANPWLGTLKRVALYDRALNQRQVDNIVSGLPPGDGASAEAAAFRVKWCEEP